MYSPDIRDACTPLSLGSNVLQVPRALWQHPLLRSTSTPYPKCAPDFGQLRHLHLDLEKSSEERSYLGIAESPISSVQTKVDLMSAPAFGRKQIQESGNLSEITAVPKLEEMELCENNNIDNSEDLNGVKGNKLNSLKEEGSSNFHASSELRKIKNKRRKSNSPKSKSPKMQKAVLIKKIAGSDAVRKKVISASKSTKNTIVAVGNVKKQKSPKNKSPKTYLISSKKTINLNSSQKKIKAVNKEKVEVRTSKSATSSSTQPDSQCSKLKTSKVARSPKLRTAERARKYQLFEEARREKDKALEEERRRALELHRLREEEEMKKLRQQTVFKAHSVRKYAPLPTAKKRALTDPISPNLSKRRRIEYSAKSCNSQAHAVESSEALSAH